MSGLFGFKRAFELQHYTHSLCLLFLQLRTSEAQPDIDMNDGAPQSTSASSALAPGCAVRWDYDDSDVAMATPPSPLSRDLLRGQQQTAADLAFVAEVTRLFYHTFMRIISILQPDLRFKLSVLRHWSRNRLQMMKFWNSLVAMLLFTLRLLGLLGHRWKPPWAPV